MRSQETGTPSCKNPCKDLEGSASRPLGSPPVPFTPSLGDSIVLVYTGISPVGGPHGAPWDVLATPDRNGLIVIKKCTLRSWLQTLLSNDTATFPLNVESSQIPSPKGSDKNPDVSAPQSFDEDSHRSQSAGMSPGPTTSPRVPPKAAPWKFWMYETRWIRERDAPLSVKALHGTRLAIRVTVPLPVPALFPPLRDAPAGTYQSGAIGALLSMQQLWNGLENGAPAPASVPPNPPMVATDVTQSLFPSFSEPLFNSQNRPLSLSRICSPSRMRPRTSFSFPEREYSTSI